MRVLVSLVTLIILTLTACSSTTETTSSVLAEINQPVPSESPATTLSPELIVTSTRSVTATLRPTSLSSPTTTSTPSPEPTPTSTPIGGGSGIILIETCPVWYDCEPGQLSLIDKQLVQSNQPYLRLEAIDQGSYKYRMVLSDPSTEKTTTVLQCSDNIYACHQSVIGGSLQEDQLYLAQSYQHIRHDGKLLTDLYRLDTRSFELTLLDHFTGSIEGFYPFSAGLQGLLGTMDNTFHGELLLYDLESLQRTTLVARRGQFFRYGAHPDEQVIWYRISDYCETELVAADGQRIALIKNSDGIIGWIDAENFLIFTASNNPPICSRTGIVLANRYGLTGQWISSSSSSWAKLSPDGERVFFTSDCNNWGCNKLVVANQDGSEPQTILESSQRTISYPVNGVFSPDGAKMIFSTGMQIWMFDSNGSNPQMLLASSQELHLKSWLK